MLVVVVVVLVVQAVMFRRRQQELAELEDKTMSLDQMFITQAVVVVDRMELFKAVQEDWAVAAKDLVAAQLLELAAALQGQ
jgi:septation ring formation regulator EzrA